MKNKDQTKMLFLAKYFSNLFREGPPNLEKILVCAFKKIYDQCKWNVFDTSILTKAFRPT